MLGTPALFATAYGNVGSSITRSVAFWMNGLNGSRCRLMKSVGYVEVKLPGRYKVSPQIASAIKAVPGVEQVELV